MSLVGKKCAHIGGLVFIKGDAVKIPSGRPTIIEFWASWCGPCRVAFPHLSQIARKHRQQGLVVVGVNIEGDSPAVRQMVVGQGASMDYTVAIDVGHQAANKLMGEAGVSGIPCAFVVDSKDVIRHIGHPMEPRFAQIVADVCKEGGGAAQAARPKPAPVTNSKEELQGMSIKGLKAILDDHGVGYADLNEKGELVNRILEKCTGDS